MRPIISTVLSLRRPERLQGAIRSASTAVKLAPENVAARTGYFYILVQVDRLNEAIEQLKTILIFDPENEFALRNMGLYYAEKENDFVAAVPFFERLYRAAPGDPESIGLLAWGYFQSGNTHEARRIVKEGGRYYRKDRVLKEQRRIILKGV